MRIHAIFAAGLLLPITSGARADDQPICADRPGKANPSCIVPAGDVQIETGLIDWSTDRSQGVRTDSLTASQTAIKFGLGDRLHLEFDLTPFVEVRARSGGLRERLSGLGDSGVAVKYRFTADSAPVQAALYPFVKLPTAGHSLGNGRVEGGLALLVDSTVGHSALSWNIAPEADLVADSNGSGYHLAMVQVASAGVGLTHRLSLSGDLWGQWDLDPAGTIRQYSLDGAAAYLLSNAVQLDAGANFGLNRSTPGIELYSGIAARF